MNYSKWDKVVEEEDHENSSSDIIASCETLRSHANELFARAEASGDPNLYRKVQEDFSQLMAKLVELCEVDNSLEMRIGPMWVSCALNSISVLIKLSQWESALATCSAIETRAGQTSSFGMSNEQLIRFRYFKALALLRIGSKESTRAARKEAGLMKNLLSSQLLESHAISPEHMKEYQSLFLQVEEAVRNNGEAFEKLLEEQTGWKLLDEKNYMSAANWFQTVIQSMPPAAPARVKAKVYSSFASACVGIGDLLKAGNALEEAAKFLKSENIEREEQLNLLLRAGSYFLKLRRFDEAQESFEAALAIEDLNLIDKCGTFEAIAKSGLGCAMAATKRFDSAVALLQQAATIHESLLRKETERYETAMKSKKESEIEKEFDGVSNCAQHLLNSLDKLTDSLAALKKFDEAISVARKSLAVGENTLRLGWKVQFKNGLMVNRPSAFPNDVSASRSTTSFNSLRRRRASTLLTLGHLTASNEATAASIDGLSAANRIDTVTGLWLQGAEELSVLGDSQQAFTAFRGVGKEWFLVAGVEPFLLPEPGLIDPEAAERGHDAFRKAALEIDRISRPASKPSSSSSSGISTTDFQAKSEELSRIQEKLLANYNAGLLALGLDANLAVRAFESAKTAQREYEDLCQELQFALGAMDADGSGVSRNSSTLTRVLKSWKSKDFRVTCGDVSYHLGHSYLRVGKLDYALNEAQLCLEQFSSVDETVKILTVDYQEPSTAPLAERENEYADRSRRKLSLELFAIALSLTGKSEESERAIVSMREHCIGPVEDVDAIVQRTRKTIAKYKRDQGPKPTILQKAVSTITSMVKPPRSLGTGVTKTPQEEMDDMQREIQKMKATGKFGPDFNLIVSYMVLLTVVLGFLSALYAHFRGWFGYDSQEL